MPKYKADYLGSSRVDRYKITKKFDWDAFWGGLFVLFIILCIIGSMSDK